ncbi:MAG: glycosyltransferase family 9 protein [Chitinophagales bacterium]|nr:glycosyltransferase family 9 protein [Chitinophagales bacterium]
MKKILFIRLSSIGDIVLSSLAIRCFKKHYPETQVDFLTKPEYVHLVQYHLGITQVLCLNDSLFNTAKEIIENDYDYVVDLHDNLRTNFLKQLLPESISFLKYRKKSIKRILSVWFKKNLYGDSFVSEQYLHALKPLGVKNDHQGLFFIIPKDDWIYSSQLPLTHRLGYIVISLGAKHFTKRMPIEKWNELIAKLSFPIILIGGQEDFLIGEQLERMDDLKCINKCGQYTLGQSASVIAQSKFVITHDTGMMHIAAALQKKTISIWGGTVPYLGFQPYVIDKAKSFIIENNQLNCRPCSKHGRSDCPKGHFKCMREINTDAIVEIVSTQKER